LSLIAMTVSQNELLMKFKLQLKTEINSAWINQVISSNLHLISDLWTL
jgi:hypothetical protein